MPEGFVPMIDFFINEKLELRSIRKKDFPIDLIVEALEQWIISKKEEGENGKN